jgi:signal transduction histidine kinase
VEFSSPAPSPGRTLAEHELLNSLGWLIRMRWLAGAAVLAGTPFTTRLLGVAVPELPLFLIGFSILAYNSVLRWALRWLAENLSRSSDACHWFARTQIVLDWISMAALIHFSGGIESPAIIFFLFHITIASLLLPHDRGFLYVTLAPLLVGGVAFLEYYGILAHHPLIEPTRHQSAGYVAAILFFFTGAVYVMAYLAMSISRRLRRRENEIAGLYQSLRAGTSSLELGEVLDRLTEATAHVIGCKGASIRLLNETGSHLEVATIYGLSEDYREKGPIDLGRALIDREALAASRTVLIEDAPNDPRTRYPDKVRAEGIESMLSAPLIARRGAIGVLRAYGASGHRFSREDAAFLTAVAAHGAVIIENAQAHQVLEELDQHKSEFVRTVTHELRSPVQVTQNLLTVLARGYKGALTPEQADLVDRARRRLEFLKTLVDDLLDLAAGKTQVMEKAVRGPISLCTVLAEVEARFDAEAQAKGLRLTLECRNEPLVVWGDRGELDRIVNNLVGNAIRYTQQGEVRVVLQRHGGSARLTIADTGIGIPEEEIPKLFSEFYRASNAKALEDRGTGLGLTIVKNLVERYDGKIWVESGEGRGTVFTVMLPLAREAAPV